MQGIALSCQLVLGRQDASYLMKKDSHFRHFGYLLRALVESASWTLDINRGWLQPLFARQEKLGPLLFTFLP